MGTGGYGWIRSDPAHRDRTLTLVPNWKRPVQSDFSKKREPQGPSETRATLPDVREDRSAPTRMSLGRCFQFSYMPVIHYVS